MGALNQRFSPAWGVWFESLSVARRKEGNNDFPQSVLAAFPPRDVRGLPTDLASLRHRPPHTPHDAAASSATSLSRAEEVMPVGGGAKRGVIWHLCQRGMDRHLKLPPQEY